MDKQLKESRDFKWAPLVIPWLPPQSIASFSLTCRTFRSLSKTITARRVADAARGLEKYPVLVSNSVDNILYPYFIYTNTSIPSISSPIQQWGHEAPATSTQTKPLISDSELLDGAGCNCINCCKEEQYCQCNEVSVYTDDGRIFLFNARLNLNFEDNVEVGGLNPNFESNVEVGGLNPNSEDTVEMGGLKSNFEGKFEIGVLSSDIEDKNNLQGLSGGPLVVMECGPACSCDQSCINRVSQQGLSVRVEIVRHLKKGWCLHVVEPVKQGAFVCEYAGEFLTTTEAKKRQRHYDEANMNKHKYSCALLVIREHLPSGQACLRLNVDATIIGNVARFINHSCDGGNLFLTLVRSSGSILPRPCLFASRDISAGEELAFSYGVAGKNSKALTCFCMSPACFGVLPSEST
ncbi:hypothetical protein SUGI_0723140 [Cryptomeria japonica]|uniref:histone-lysine N-methyltransferase SUVR3 n=1 Tax=Cryptomeria japonica TaxID=3369 RepID=UPI002414BD32|nr:histone-lysine N-methyltransferase SUVR3 [Cryptomeria japonica]GLJ36041.1 hypothetical protein SUGI_0723140 [Cryptomeria japonica]